VRTVGAKGTAHPPPPRRADANHPTIHTGRTWGGVRRRPRQADDVALLPPVAGGDGARVGDGGGAAEVRDRAARSPGPGSVLTDRPPVTLTVCGWAGRPSCGK